MIYFEWVAGHRSITMLLIFTMAAICQYINYKHSKDGRAKRDDLGYFWRKAREGDREAKIMVRLTYAAILLGLNLIISMFVTAR